MLAVVDGGFDVDHRVSGDDAALQGLADALVHGGMGLIAMAHRGTYVLQSSQASPAHLLGGVILMFGATLILFILPWLDRSPVRSAKYRPYFRAFFWIFVLDCIVLGWIGANPPDGEVIGIPFIVIGQLATLYYFAYFIVIIPVVSTIERPKPLPHSISEPVLKGGGTPAGAQAKPMEKA